MKLILQRVAESSVLVDGKEVSHIKKGVTIFLGVEKGDGENEASFLADKVLNLRIFPDENGKMNLSCLDIRGEILAVSQFTLAGDCSRGRRPGFDRAADPETAEMLYRAFIKRLREGGVKVSEGIFGASMMVRVTNDGPVTFVLEK